MKRKRNFSVSCDKCGKTVTVKAFDVEEAKAMIAQHGIRKGVCAGCRNA